MLGTVQPIAEIGAIARERDLLFLVDAAQTAGVVPIDVQAMHIDLLAFPGHKSLLGPTGTGALYVGAARPACGPGARAAPAATRPARRSRREFPYFLEGGTPNVLGVAGLAAGIKYVEERGPRRRSTSTKSALSERLWQRLDEIGGFEVFGHRDHAPARRHAELPQRGAAGRGARRHPRPGVRHRHPAGPALCPVHPPGHRHVSRGAVRVSPGPFNTEEDIDPLADALAE